MAERFSNEDADKILHTTIPKEQVILTGAERHKLFKKLHKALGTDDYFVVKGTLWELLKHMVANSPDNIEKWMSVRWLLSEIAKFAQEDYGKKISG
jgi:hypothetical protein